MTRFFTDIRYRDGFASDAEGQEFASLTEAREGACQAARQAVAHEIEAGHDKVHLEYEIHDESGAEAVSVPVDATVSGLA